VIGFLDGAVAALRVDGCLLEVAGVGYRLFCSSTTMSRLPPVGGRCRLWTHTYVREESLALYGFATEAEQDIFEALLGVAGVGPKVALQVCSAFTPEDLRRALVTEDIPVLSSVPGIGRKTAQRMVLDLKEKMDLPDLQLVGRVPDAVVAARSALENLGYSTAEVRAALAGIDAAPDDSLERVVKAALSLLDRPERTDAR
jgi:Holliday junction DNA helicase RuvA